MKKKLVNYIRKLMAVHIQSYKNLGHIAKMKKKSTLVTHIVARRREKKVSSTYRFLSAMYPYDRKNKKKKNKTINGNQEKANK